MPANRLLYIVMLVMQAQTEEPKTVDFAWRNELTINDIEFLWNVSEVELLLFLHKWECMLNCFILQLFWNRLFMCKLLCKENLESVCMDLRLGD